MLIIAVVAVVCLSGCQPSPYIPFGGAGHAGQYVVFFRAAPHGRLLIKLGVLEVMYLCFGTSGKVEGGLAGKSRTSETRDAALCPGIFLSKKLGSASLRLP